MIVHCQWDVLSPAQHSRGSAWSLKERSGCPAVVYFLNDVLFAGLQASGSVPAFGCFSGPLHGIRCTFGTRERA